MKVLWICIFISVASMVSSKLTFHGDKVFRVKLETEEQVALIQSMDKKIKLDFWHPDSAGRLVPQMDVDFHVHVNHSKLIQHLLDQNTIQYEILFHNLQEGIDAQLDNQEIQMTKYSYTKYNSWSEISDWMCQMVSEYPKLIRRLFIGSTSKGRDMSVLRIGKKRGNKAIYMDCGIHAREWISPAFCQWFVKELAEGYTSNKKNNSMKKLLKKLTFYILPVLNIDGYIWSWNKMHEDLEIHGILVEEDEFGLTATTKESCARDRMWRKNRSQSPDSNCVGTDLNRNFNASWCSTGASDDPCEDIYCGTAAESEKETKNVADFIRKHQTSIKAFISIHSYSQMLLYPYGYTFKPVPNAEELHNISKGAVTALYSSFKTTYEYGPSATTIYPTSGGSDDWAYDQGIKYCFTFELRDTGKYGFLLPESKISPTCKETMLAVNYIANYVISHTS